MKMIPSKCAKIGQNHDSFEIGIDPSLKHISMLPNDHKQMGPWIFRPCPVSSEPTQYAKAVVEGDDDDRTDGGEDACVPQVPWVAIQ